MDHCGMQVRTGAGFFPSDAQKAFQGKDFSGQWFYASLFPFDDGSLFHIDADLYKTDLPSAPQRGSEAGSGRKWEGTGRADQGDS